MNFSLKHLLKIFNFVFVFLDNHAVHHVAEVEEIIYGAGALVRYLPPYSPDFNPIEGSYHQAKHFIRENDIAFRGCLQPHAFILHTFGQISPENCEGYFRNSGYEWQFDWSNNFEPFRYTHRCFMCGILQRGSRIMSCYCEWLKILK